VLSEEINSLCSIKDLDLEINPLRVYTHMIEQIEASGSPLPDNLEKGITVEEAAQNREVQKVIAPRVETLMKLANQFLDVIVGGINEVPYGIRWICKQIRSLSKRKYPDAHDDTIVTLIGGFFFLRFINPAIVTPRSYMLIESQPADHPKRTLTYVSALFCCKNAKMLLLITPDCQNVAKCCQQAFLRQGAVHGFSSAVHL